MAASVRDVARLAGVSVGTVSNVLNERGRVDPDMAARVHTAIERLGYVRNDAARQLRAGRSRAIAFISLDAANPFFTALARGAEDQAAAAGFSVIHANSSEKEQREARHIDLFEEQRVHGVLISPFGDVAERLRAMRKRGIPAVVVDRVSSDSSFSSVSVDDVAGGEAAVAHLLATGRRRIAYIGGPAAIRQVTDRLTGARRAVAAVTGDSVPADGVPGAGPGVTLEVIEVDALSLPEGQRAGHIVTARPRREWPDAVFAANDLLAIGFLQAVFSIDPRAVPGRIAVVGYDDIAFAAAAAVPLTSVRQPAEKIGAAAVRILLEEAGAPDAAPQHVVFQPELIVRDSTAAS
ncbi:MAG TPA: LacI family DNA-binding transcriptional regulator [Trebonia sp.]|jgi:LacI family transcriptional regulator